MILFITCFRFDTSCSFDFDFPSCFWQGWLWLRIKFLIKIWCLFFWKFVSHFGNFWFSKVFEKFGNFCRVIQEMCMVNIMWSPLRLAPESWAIEGVRWAYMVTCPWNSKKCRCGLKKYNPQAQAKKKNICLFVTFFDNKKRCVLVWRWNCWSTMLNILFFKWIWFILGR